MSDGQWIAAIVALWGTQAGIVTAFYRHLLGQLATCSARVAALEAAQAAADVAQAAAMVAQAEAMVAQAEENRDLRRLLAGALGLPDAAPGAAPGGAT